MRVPGLRTISARIIVGFAVLICAFGGVSLLTVVNMERLSREIRVIRTGYLKLALKSKDLAERQKALWKYLKDDLVQETPPARVKARIRGFRFARTKVITEAEGIVQAHDGLPPGHQAIFESTAQDLASFRRTSASYDALYDSLLAAPPTEMGPAPFDIDEQHQRTVARAALTDLEQREAKLFHVMSKFEEQQRRRVVNTAEFLESNEKKVRNWTIYFGTTAVALGLLMVGWATLTLRPLQRLREGARRIASGDYDSRIDESGGAEVADIAREFNAMAHAIEERERELVRSERLAAVGKMAAMITHEVRNPLSSIGLNTELLEEELGALPPTARDEAQSLCRAIHKEVDRLTGITEEYLHFARLPKPKLQLETINPMIANTLDFEREQLALRGVRLEASLAGELPTVLVDDAQLRQALLNLLRNAADAVADIGGGEVRVVTRMVERDGVSFVEIELVDDGPGVAADLLPKLFDPFFSTKSGGTGLGLALTHQIVREHGGTIRVDSTPGHGATFTVALPAVDPSVAPTDDLTA